mmetsp:Transcript_17057/g.24658  ORF Transcript_17057/g.24658 Transcript_17057/m.24658 type:complete len:133 (+) Transcript_17057:86-484(+)|eukprot:CAMPEP_0202441324 /NCGR_PEP_ID=MMETSP1360-20130828/807_1 /ASSEMBLY_ACC=CAM_ASM_000848 /TAXON_ID=515479 /ORGANISM="Licmophora paradoxa, Strain CCMP2313" /LENGTH=132 /DNA_ID=CAMNT_0049056255 /DNA_START=29 /DNA_END=427 /DNA_ORIENTATION=+
MSSMATLALRRLGATSSRITCLRPAILNGMSDINARWVSSGTVKWFDAKKGYGFITPSSEGNDIFVHWSAVKGDGFKSLMEGEEVEYEVTDDGKASDVTGPDGAPVKGTSRMNNDNQGGGYFDRKESDPFSF